MMETFFEICQEIGCLVSMEKTEWATSIITFLGVLLNGETKFLSLPDDKKRKAMHLIDWVVQTEKLPLNWCNDLQGHSTS